MNRHSLRVARNFTPATPAWWLAILHDIAEDIVFLRRTVRMWPALDAITKRNGEDCLADYIPRVAAHPLARQVKPADMADNLMR